MFVHVTLQILPIRETLFTDRALVSINSFVSIFVPVQRAVRHESLWTFITGKLLLCVILVLAEDVILQTCFAGECILAVFTLEKRYCIEILCGTVCWAVSVEIDSGGVFYCFPWIGRFATGVSGGFLGRRGKFDWRRSYNTRFR